MGENLPQPSGHLKNVIFNRNGWVEITEFYQKTSFQKGAEISSCSGYYTPQSLTRLVLCGM
jgi:hypothetical protein